MVTQSILRNGMASPARAMLKAPSTRSILKRPTALPLSPAYPYAASFSVQVSPRINSPHVQFLASPFLTSVHSAASYDRVYTTSWEGFALSPPPKRIRSTAAAQDSPDITDFEDPRSPKVQPAAKQAALRFATFTGNQTVTRPSKTLAKSLSSYPRSPYPSAPFSPTAEAEEGGVRWPKDRDCARARSCSLGTPKRNKKGLTLGAPTDSPLDRGIFSPSVSSINRAKKPAPLDLESRLSQDFWQSLSLETTRSDDESMVTALEYPESAVEYEGKMDMDTRPQTSQPQVMYGSANGALWSPEIPEPSASVDRIKESLMSPGLKSGFSKIVRKDFTAPSPNDPFAAFPSFTAAIEMGSWEGSITYPPRVVLERGI